MDIPNKEAADHAITFFAGRILLGTETNCQVVFIIKEYKLNQEIGRFDNKKLLFTVVSKDMALANVVHFLKSDGAEAVFLANSTSLASHCKIKE